MQAHCCEGRHLHDYLSNGRLNLKRVEELAWVLTDLRNRGKDVILVSSGAIGVGAVRMAMKNTPDCCARKAGGGSCGTGNADADLS